jgi:hypothetical protein
LVAEPNEYADPSDPTMV